MRINELPNELPNPIRFSEDQIHAAYDAASAYRFWRLLLQADRVFKIFRTGFTGKCSPVHFFWGSFDFSQPRVFRAGVLRLIPAAFHIFRTTLCVKPIRMR